MEDVRETTPAPAGRPIEIAPVKIELSGFPKRATGLIALLLVCLSGLSVAWIASERRPGQRVLHPESKLSVLELETSAIKFDGIDGGFLRGHSQVGISFHGYARLGVDLSKAAFDLDRKQRILSITLPKPEVTEVNVTDTHTWDRSTNATDEKKLDALECKLCNDALAEFRALASEPFYADTAAQLARSTLRAYYRRNYPDIGVEFK